jgi:hypothetical protein
MTRFSTPIRPPTAFIPGASMSPVGGPAVPFHRQLAIRTDAKAVLVDVAEIILRVGETLVGGLAKPSAACR